VRKREWEQTVAQLIIIALFLAGLAVVFSSWSCKAKRTDTAGLDAHKRAALAQKRTFSEAFRSVGTFHLEESDSSLIGRVYDVQVSNGGEIYVCDPTSYAVLVFGKRGEFKRKIGTKGEGPGQFQWLASASVSNRGEIFALDSRLRRVSVFDSTGHFLKLFFLKEGGGQLIRLLGTDFFCVFDPYHLKSTDNLVRVYDVQGSLRSSFFSLPKIVEKARYVVAIGSIDCTSKGILFVTHGAEYQVAKYDKSGRRLAGFGRNPSWFRAFDASPPVPGKPFKYTFVTGIVSLSEPEVVLVQVSIPSDKPGGPFRNVIDIFDMNGNFITGDLETSWQLECAGPDNRILFIETPTELTKLGKLPNPTIHWCELAW